MPRRRPHAEDQAGSSDRQIGFLFTFPNTKPLRLWSADELYDDMTQQIAVDAGEDHRIERKSARYNARDLGDYFSMWANTAPNGGVILVGVENDGSITGCSKVESSHIDQLLVAGKIFAPEARHQYKQIDVVNRDGNADCIFAIRVAYRADRVVETTAGLAFVRRGGAKYPLNETEKRELQVLKGQIEIEREPIALDYPRDFNVSLVQQFATNVRRDRRLRETVSDEEVMILRRLGKTKDGKFVPNLACALLFANDVQENIPGCKIRFLRFSGTREGTGHDFAATKSEWIEGNVPLLIQQAAETVETQLREFMRLGDDKKFFSTPEYPKDAWYEAIVNACVHRSYSLKNMHTVIKMFDDRLEIESPGGFPPMVTPENIYDMHVPRNPHLMDAMFYLRFVQCAHEGTQRIRDSMEKLGLPAPVFRETLSNAAYVRVTLRNDVDHRSEFVDTQAYMVLGESIVKTLDAFAIRVINHVAEHGPINITEASRIANKRWHSTKKAMMALVERGIFDHVRNRAIERDAYQYFALKKRFSDKLKNREQSGG